MRLMFFVRIAIFCLFGIVSNTGQAAASDADINFQNATQEMRYRALIEEFRCPKCQNASLAGSDAPIAQDLKYKTYLLVKQGQSDDQIRQYMTSRYGDFMSYRPPINRATWVLWFAPLLVLMIVVLVWLIRTPSRKRLEVVPLSAEESWRLNQLLGKDSVNDQDIRHDH